MCWVCRDDEACQLHKKGPSVNIQSWMIKSWATLECYLPPDPGEQPRFKHASTQVRDDGSASGMRAGDTVWIAQDDQWPAGLAWEWVEARPGLLMLADPNSIITNLAVVDKDRQLVTGLKKIVALNQLVHALNWQTEVRNQVAPTQQRHSTGARASSTTRSLFQQTTCRLHSTAAPGTHAAQSPQFKPRPLTSAEPQRPTDGLGRISRTRASDKTQDACVARSLSDLRRAA